MPIDDLRAEGLANATKAADAFKRTLPADLRDAYDELIGSHVAAATKTARDTVKAVDTLSDPSAVSVNDPEVVRRDTVAEGSRRVSEALKSIDEGIDRFGSALAKRAIPDEPKDSSKVALARQTVEQVLGPVESRDHRSVTALERLVDEGDPAVVSVLLKSSWGRSVIDSIPMADRAELENRAMDQAAAGKFGDRYEAATKPMSAWGELRRARTEAGNADVVLSDLARKS